MDGGGGGLKGWRGTARKSPLRAFSILSWTGGQTASSRGTQDHDWKS
jgi:hypothetical protein